VRRVIAAVAVLIMLAGCTRVHPCDPRDPSVSLNEVNRIIDARRVRVSLLDGTWTHADHVSVAADSVRLTARGTPQQLEDHPRTIGHAVATSEVEAITMSNRPRGALQGGLWGLGIAATVGFVAGISSGGGEFGFGGSISAVESGALGAFVCGAIGALAGVVVGVISGSNDVYDFTAAPAELGGPPSH